MRFQKCEFCEKWDFTKVNFCRNWDFQYVNFRIKCGFLPQWASESWRRDIRRRREFLIGFQIHWDSLPAFIRLSAFSFYDTLMQNLIFSPKMKEKIFLSQNYQYFSTSILALKFKPVFFYKKYFCTKSDILSQCVKILLIHFEFQFSR